jgi:hypothetical protein
MGVYSIGAVVLAVTADSVSISEIDARAAIVLGGCRRADALTSSSRDDLPGL